MRSFSVLIALLFALVATSFAAPDIDFADIAFPELETRKDRNNTANHGNPAKKACKEMKTLMRITQLAANQTKLDKLVADGKLTAAKVDQLKQKAADAKPKLDAMSTNTTLTTECATLDAEKKMKGACKHMKRLQRMADLVKNTTALDAFAVKHKLNSTRVDMLKAKVQKSQAKLTELSSNTTLTAFCSKQKSAGGGPASGNGNGGGSSSSTSGTTQAGTTNPNTPATSGVPQQAATNGASGTHMSAETLPYIVVSLFVGTFVLLL